MNVLGLSATFGVLVLVFQDGRLEGLLGDESQGAPEITQPLVLLAIAFGLSTDYGVFLLTRIKEARDAGRLQRGGRRARDPAHWTHRHRRRAAARRRDRGLRDVGDHLHQGARRRIAVAVAIDATIIRGTAVPALMKLSASATGGRRGRSRDCTRGCASARASRYPVSSSA